MKKRIFLLLLLFLVGCKNEPSNNTIKIGVFEPLSGLYEESGKEIVKGIQLAHKENQYVLGKKVELVFYDTKSLEFESANAVSYLAGQKDVIAMLGTYGVDSMSHALPVIEAANIPTIASGSTYSEIQKSEWSTCLSMNDIHQATAMAQFAEEYLHLKNIAIIIDEEMSYGEILAYTFSHQISPNVKVHLLPYHTGDTTFQPQIRRMKNLSIDGVYCPGDPVTSAYLIQAIKQDFPYMTIMGADRWENPSFYEEGKTDTEGVYFTGHYSPNKLSSTKGPLFISSYKKNFGTRPNSFSALGYDSYQALIHAIKQADSTNPHKIQYHIRNIRGLAGVTGQLNVEYGPHEYRPIKILQQQGKDIYLNRIVEVKN